MRYILGTVLVVALAVFEGCKDDSKTPTTTGGGDQLGPDQNIPRNPKSRRPIKPVEFKLKLKPDGREIIIKGSIYSGGEREGDFGWMMRQDKYKKSLFVFNDNEEEYDAYMGLSPSQLKTNVAGCGKGGGNAGIRPQRCVNPKRALGVPTGRGGEGYKSLDSGAKDRIDGSIKAMRDLVSNGDYDTVIFSQDEYEETLGSGIYQVAPAVKKYIFDSLIHLEAPKSA